MHERWCNITCLKCQQDATAVGRTDLYTVLWHAHFHLNNTSSIRINFVIMSSYHENWYLLTFIFKSSFLRFTFSTLLRLLINIQYFTCPPIFLLDHCRSPTRLNVLSCIQALKRNRMLRLVMLGTCLRAFLAEHQSNCHHHKKSYQNHANMQSRAQAR